MSKKLLMSNVNNTVVDDGWDFEWYASSGVLPPNDGADQNAIIRTFKDDYLEITPRSTTFRTSGLTPFRNL